MKFSSFYEFKKEYRISSYKALPRIIPATLIIPAILTILCSGNVVFSNKTRIWRLCKIIIPAGLIWGNTVIISNFWERNPPHKSWKVVNSNHNGCIKSNSYIRQDMARCIIVDRSVKLKPKSSYKGQLISKCPFVVSKSIKKPTKVL